MTLAITIRTVPALDGWRWITRGFALLRANPTHIHMACFYFLGVITVMSLVPLVGGLLAALLMPALYLGVMATIAQSETTSSNQPTKLIEALKSPFAKDVQGQRSTLKRLAMLGIVYSISVLVAVLLGSFFVSDDAMKALTMLTNQNAQSAATSLDAKARSDAIEGLLPALMGVMLFYAPVSLAFWFTQQLVGWHGQSIAKAVFFSWIACWRNKGAFAVFSMAWVVLFGAAMFGLTAIMSLLGSATLSGLLLSALSLLMIVLAMCSFYASYESLVQVDTV